MGEVVASSSDPTDADRRCRITGAARRQTSPAAERAPTCDRGRRRGRRVHGCGSRRRTAARRTPAEWPWRPCSAARAVGRCLGGGAPDHSSARYTRGGPQARGVRRRGRAVARRTDGGHGGAPSRAAGAHPAGGLSTGAVARPPAATDQGWAPVCAPPPAAFDAERPLAPSPRHGSGVGSDRKPRLVWHGRDTNS